MRQRCTGQSVQPPGRAWPIRLGSPAFSRNILVVHATRPFPGQMAEYSLGRMDLRWYSFVPKRRSLDIHSRRRCCVGRHLRRSACSTAAGHYADRYHPGSFQPRCDGVAVLQHRRICPNQPGSARYIWKCRSRVNQWAGIRKIGLQCYQGFSNSGKSSAADPVGIFQRIQPGELHQCHDNGQLFGIRANPSCGGWPRYPVRRQGALVKSAA